MKLVRFSILVITVLVVLDLIVGFCSCSEEEFVAMANLGGLRDVGESNQNKLELEELAKFAVDEHNKKQNTVLEFGKLVKAKEQVVAGTMYYLTLEAIDAGTKKIYEAKVWVKPWLNFKELQEFKQVGDGSFSSSDLGANQG